MRCCVTAMNHWVLLVKAATCRATYVVGFAFDCPYHRNNRCLPRTTTGNQPHPLHAVILFQHKFLLLGSEFTLAGSSSVEQCFLHPHTGRTHCLVPQNDDSRALNEYTLLAWPLLYTMRERQDGKGGKSWLKSNGNATSMMPCKWLRRAKSRCISISGLMAELAAKR